MAGLAILPQLNGAPCAASSPPCALSRKVHFLPFSVHTDDGYNCKGAHKVIEYPNSCWWELRRVLPCIFVERKRVVLHKIIKSELPVWIALWARFNTLPRLVLAPSERAFSHILEALQDPTKDAEHMPGWGVDERFVRSEYMMRSDGLLLVLMHMASSSRRQAHRARALALLGTMLSFLDQKILVGVGFSELIDDSAHLCPQVGPSGLCSHLEPLRLTCAMQCGPSLFQSVASWLVLSCKASQACVAARTILQVTLGLLCDSIGQALSEKDADAPERQEAVRGPVKRRRVDEDLKALVTGGARQAGRVASSGAAVAAFVGASSESLGRAWVRKENAAHASACWAACSSRAIDGVVSIAPDAARHGQPQKDYLVSPVWVPQHTAGGWLPPQAPLYIKVASNACGELQHLCRGHARRELLCDCIAIVLFLQRNRSHTCTIAMQSFAFFRANTVFLRAIVARGACNSWCAFAIVGLELQQLVRSR